MVICLPHCNSEANCTTGQLQSCNVILLHGITVKKKVGFTFALSFLSPFSAVLTDKQPHVLAK